MRQLWQQLTEILVLVSLENDMSFCPLNEIQQRRIHDNNRNACTQLLMN